MACTPCWQQRQVFMMAMRQRDAWMAAQAAMRGVHIATDKYIRGVDVNRKYGGTFFVKDTGQPRPSGRVR